MTVIVEADVVGKTEGTTGVAESDLGDIRSTGV